MEKIWLIKIKNVIYGPVNFDELQEMILNKKLSLNDEVSRSLSQWIYVKNCKELMDFYYKSVKKSVKDETTGGEKTFIHEIFKGGRLKEKFQKKTDSPHLSVERVEDASVKNLKKLDLESAHEVDFDLHESTDKPQPSEEELFERSDQIRKKAQKKARYIMSIFWVAVVASACIAVFYFVSKNLKKPLNTEDLLKARQAWNIGQYELALSFFKKSSLQNPQDIISLSSLMVQLEDDVYSARKELEKIKKGPSFPRMILLEGMIQLKDQNWLQAENLFDQAQMEEPLLALLNKAILKIKMQKKEEGVEILNQILSQFSLDPVLKNSVLFLKALYQDSNEELENLAKQRRDYSQEASLLLLYRSEDVEDFIWNVLDRDPDLTFNHRYDILSYNPFDLWEGVLLDHCSSIFKRSPENSYFIALYSFCLAQAHLSDQALELIEKAVSQSPKDSLIQAIYGFILRKNNLDEKSFLPIELSVGFNQGGQLILPFILQARVCERKRDWKCAKEYWNKVKDKDPYSLSAQAGLALVLYNQGKKEQAKKKIQQGLNLSPHYIPFLRLDLINF